MTVEELAAKDVEWALSLCVSTTGQFGLALQHLREMRANPPRCPRCLGKGFEDMSTTPGRLALVACSSCGGTGCRPWSEVANG